jgi:hypothetical protein
MDECTPRALAILTLKQSLKGMQKGRKEKEGWK